jgi:SP family arabinose:H+ symporter-like MFS transporter
MGSHGKTPLVAFITSPVLSAVTAAMGGLLFGFDTAVVSGVTHSLTMVYQLSPAFLGLTVSSALVGTILGAITAGFPAERLGRKPTLLLLAGLYFASGVGCAFAWNWSALVFFRVIGGLGIGGSSVLGPTYIAEVSPPKLRGRLVGLFQFNICSGILVAYLSNYLIGLASFGSTEWRWKLGVSAIPALVFGLLLLAIPESPRWLVSKGRESEARDVLEKIAGKESDQLLHQLLSARDSLAHQSRNVLFTKAHTLPIFLAVSIGFFNQMSGVNAILYYINDIFAQAGFDTLSSNLQALAVGATNFIFTMVAMSVIDRLGRKRLLLIGAVGTSVCLGGIAAIFITHIYQSLLVFFLVGFIGLFSFSQGAVIWVYLSEVFPTDVRAKGTSLGSLTHWLMNAIVSGLYPVVAAGSGGKPFIFFACMTVMQFFVVLLYYPETKGVSLEEMQARLAASTRD